MQGSFAEGEDWPERILGGGVVDDRVAKGLGLSEEVDLGRVRIHRFKAEAHTLLQQVGIHKGQAQWFKGQPLERALASSIAYHELPQLGSFAQEALGSQAQNTPPIKVPRLYSTKIWLSAFQPD